MISQGGDGGGDDDDDGDGGRIFQAHPSPIPLRPGIKYPVRINPHSDIEPPIRGSIGDLYNII